MPPQPTPLSRVPPQLIILLWCVGGREGEGGWYDKMSNCLVALIRVPCYSHRPGRIALIGPWLGTTMIQYSWPDPKCYRLWDRNPKCCFEIANECFLFTNIYRANDNVLSVCLNSHMTWTGSGVEKYLILELIITAIRSARPVSCGERKKVVDFWHWG